MNIKLSTSRILQGVLVLAHILNIVVPVVPAEYKAYITTALGVCNVIVNEWAHNSNTDGTPGPGTANDVGGAKPTTPEAKA